MSRFQFMEAQDVQSAETFAAYCQQRIGIPYPSGTQMMALKKHAKSFFAEYPNATWQTMVRVAEWCSNNRRRVAHTAGLFSMVRYAWAANYVPELDPVQVIDVDLEKQIEAALLVERDVQWRHRLLGSTGSMRKVIYDAWRLESSRG